VSRHLTETLNARLALPGVVIVFSAAPRLPLPMRTAKRGDRATQVRMPLAAISNFSRLSLLNPSASALGCALLLGLLSLPATPARTDDRAPPKSAAITAIPVRAVATPLAATPLVHNASPVANPTASASLLTNAGPTVSMEMLDDKYRLAIGDRLSFRIQEDEEEPKALLVTDSGDLEVPYLGRFPADGKTCKLLAHELKTALEKEYYYQATVIIAVNSMTRSRGKVYLVGPVRAPGPQEIPSDEVLTLSKAIMRAGGFSDYADRHNVKVTRKVGPALKDNTRYVIDVDLILEKGKTERDLPLEPGDVVLVPERLIRF